MATSTLIQKLDGTALISNVSGSPGSYTSVAIPDVSNRRQVETFLVTLTNGGGAPAVVTLASGTWMAFDTTKTGAEKVLFVRVAPGSAATANLVVGPVAETISTRELPAGASETLKVEVVVSGWAIANVDDAAAIVVGDALVVDATAGMAEEYTAADVYLPCATCLTAPAGDKAEVFVLKRF
jgi:hypothetical protein